MIESFGNALAEDLFDDKRTRATRSFPPEPRRVARRKFLYLHDASELGDLRALPGNRLELFKGDWAGFHSIRINDQYRICFVWTESGPEQVEITDYH